ncbi:hypothetical protein ACIBW9_05455 [Streptomyces sp. NPDC049541]|uniref:hypothetical protein n=1 Tax=Streptomyces sp. NPDC049541 TaxID=3365594 RepID=UPI0037AEF17E
MRFRTGSIATAVAIAGVMTFLSSGVANASAAKCNYGNCVEVVGKDLYVGAVNVSEEKGYLRSGYYFAKYVIGSKETWSWTPWTSGGHTIYFPKLSDRSYPNGTAICGGVEPTKAELDLWNEACVTVHN